MKQQHDIKHLSKFLKILLAAFSFGPIIMGVALTQKADLQGFDVTVFNDKVNFVVGIAAIVCFIVGCLNIIFINSLARPANKFSGTVLGPSKLSQSADLLIMTTVVSYAMFESCSLHGLIITQFSKNLSMFPPFVVLTYIGLGASLWSINKLEKFELSNK